MLVSAKLRAELGAQWRAYAAKQKLDPDRPTLGALRAFYADRSPALGLSGVYWNDFREALALEGYVPTGTSAT